MKDGVMNEQIGEAVDESISESPEKEQISRSS